VRWYKSSEVDPTINISYISNGNKVPKTDGVRPLMEIPDEFPDDVDHRAYIATATKLLKEIGHAGA
jgi:hypothetical protein